MPIRPLLCLFFCVFASIPLFSENANASTNEKWYEVEVILFANTDTSNYDAELWQDAPGYPNLKDNISLYSEGELLLEEYSGTLPPYFMKTELEASNNKDSLNKYARRLEKSPKYQLLFHHAWQQQLNKNAVFLTDTPNTDPVVYENEKLLPNETNEVIGGNSRSENIIVEEQTPEELLLSALLDEEKDFSQPLSHLPFFISEFDQIELLDDIRNAPVSHHTDLSYEGPPFHKVYGNLVLTKGRYLHMSLDFLYRGEPYTPVNTESEVTPNSAIASEENNDFSEDTNTASSFSDSDDPFENSDSNAASILSDPQIASTILDNKEAKPPIPGFRIKDSKRVRLNRLYYFDHPLFGVIIRVIRHTPSPSS